MKSLLWPGWFISLLDLAHRAEQKLPQLHLHLRFHGPGVRPGCDAADQVQPVERRLLQEVAGRGHQRFICQRNKEGWRVALHAVAKESRRSDAYHGEWLSIYYKSRAHHGAILPKLLLPCAETHHRYARRALAVILRVDGSSKVGGNPECREVIAGDIFAPIRLGWLAAAIAPHSNQTSP